MPLTGWVRGCLSLLLTGRAEGRWLGQPGDPACHFELWASDRKKQGPFGIHSKKYPPGASSRIPWPKGCQDGCGSGRAGRGVLARLSLQRDFGCGSCCWTCLPSCQFTANNRASPCAASGPPGWGPLLAQRTLTDTKHLRPHCWVWSALPQVLSYAWKGEVIYPVSHMAVCIIKTLVILRICQIKMF